MHIDLLDPMPAGFVRFVDNNFVYELPQERWVNSVGAVYFRMIFRKLWTLRAWVSAAATTARRLSEDCFNSACSASWYNKFERVPRHKPWT